MLRIGDAAPDVTLPLAFADGRRDPVALSALLEQGHVVLSFFPLAFTRVCTTQMCDARDSHAALDALDAQVVGYSCDSSFVNVHYAKAHRLEHGIYSDPNRHYVDALWETQTTAGVERVPKRGWMLITREGKVADLYVTDTPGAPWPGNKGIEDALARLTG